MQRGGVRPNAGRKNAGLETKIGILKEALILSIYKDIGFIKDKYGDYEIPDDVDKLRLDRALFWAEKFASRLMPQEIKQDLDKSMTPVQKVENYLVLIANGITKNNESRGSESLPGAGTLQDSGRAAFQIDEGTIRDIQSNLCEKVQ